MTGRSLKQQLIEEDFIVAPGIYDGVSARIADQLGFGALYLSGYAVSASLLGKPDAGFLSMNDMAGRVRTVCSVISTPLIADADTGFGGVPQVMETVQAYEQAGAAAIQLEDQEFPKRCGHTRGRRVVPLTEAIAKIRAAADARQSDDFLIIARTDARTTHGVEECFRRADAFLEAGADILFIESPETREEISQIGLRYRDQWLVANMVGGGKTPLCSPEELSAMGYNISIHPLFALGAVVQTLGKVLPQVHHHKEQSELAFEALNRITGFEDIWTLDEVYNTAGKSGDKTE